jgi:hypothetical protein
LGSYPRTAAATDLHEYVSLEQWRGLDESLKQTLLNLG